MGLKKRKKPGEDEPDEPAVKIAQHRHYSSCGRAIPPDTQHCSDACKAEYDNAVKSRKMLVYVMYAMVAIMMFALATNLIGGG